MKKEKGTLKWSELLGYGVGGMFAYGFQLCVTGYFLMIFMTDVAGFSTTLAATLNTAIQVIKMITMIFSGVLIDKINFRSGKYRTWSLICGIGLGVFFPLSFVWFPLPTTTYAVVFLIIYSLQTLFYNMGWTAQRAIIGKMARNNSDVVMLNTTAQFSGVFSSVVFSVIGYPLLNLALWADTKQIYGGSSAVYGSCILIGAILLYRLCGKYEATADDAQAMKKDNVSFLQMFSALKGPMIPFFLAYSFTAAQTGFFNTLLVYYTTYVLKNPAVAATAVGAISVAGVIGCLIAPMLTKRFSKKSIFIATQVICAVGYIGLAFFGSTAVGFVGIRALVTFVGMPSSILMGALCNDIGDCQEMKGEAAPRAFLQGLAGSTTRLGLVLSTAIASFAFAAIGYSEGIEFTESMIKSMVVLIAVLPGASCALSALCMLFYKVDEKDIAAYHAQKNN
ncbi:MAG: MFS transporter [Clostridia bacterium]|nr:MFS transporter [Clostridia bacterium]